MKLFLASHDLGAFAEELRDLVGDNRKSLIITNARDDKSPEIRRQAVADKIAIFKSAGFDATELDLREYLSKDPDELRRFVDEYDPGLIYAIGGNVFLLATALVVSGMDDIIRDRLARDVTVYGGGSAGAMVATEDIETYERDDLRVEESGAYYGTEAITSGLGLITAYLIPHANIAGKHHITKFYQDQIAKVGGDAILLNEDDAYIVNGGHKEIKRA